MLRGISYPLQLENGSLKLSERANVVREQILSVIETNPGERIMLPLYGLREQIFNSLAPAVVISDIENVISRWVPEAKNVRVSYDKNPRKYEEGRLDITISFQYEERDIVISAEISDAG